MSNLNENRPGYKKTKVGWIPEEWGCVKLNEISNINPESITNKTDRDYTFYYIDLSAVDEGKIEFPSNKIVFSSAPSRARRKVKENDILLSTVRPNLKGFVYISFDVNDIICSTGYAVIRGEKGVVKQYLYHNLFSHNTERYFYRCVAGSNYPALNDSDVDNLTIPLPPLPEQKKITEILSAWDRAIEQVGKLIDAKSKLKKALMQQLLTGKLRFKEFVKTSNKQMTRYGTIPADWDYPKVDKVAKEVSTRNTNGDNVPVLFCTKYDGLVESLKYFGRQVFSKDTSTYKVVKRGQFAYATNHIEEGSIGMLDFLDEGLVSPMYTVFQTGDRVYTPFLYKVFKTEIYRHIFEVNTSASVNRRGSLRWHGFALIHVPLPSLDEQKKISDAIDSIDKEIKLLGKQVDTLKQQKKGLMQKLLTGQVRVKMD